MPDIAALRKRAQNAIDQRRDALFDLSRAIHANPETAYEERQASTRLADFLDKNGFKVTRGYRGIETSYETVPRWILKFGPVWHGPAGRR